MSFIFSILFCGPVLFVVCMYVLEYFQSNGRCLDPYRQRKPQNQPKEPEFKYPNVGLPPIVKVGRSYILKQKNYKQ